MLGIGSAEELRRLLESVTDLSRREIERIVTHWRVSPGVQWGDLDREFARQIAKEQDRRPRK